MLIMLVLTRCINETVVIGESLRVCVVLMRGQNAELRFEAPPHFRIRSESDLCVYAPPAVLSLDLGDKVHILDSDWERLAEVPPSERLQCIDSPSWKHGDQVGIILIRVGGGKLRLGIEAPKHMPIFREEIA